MGRSTQYISHESTIRIRFSEVDQMRIVWHGHYAQYLEEGREALGKKYGMGYMDVYADKFMIPVVNLNINYKKPLHYGKEYMLVTKLIKQVAAKVVFNYEIWDAERKEVLIDGESTQVFIDLNGELQLFFPKFYSQWLESLNWIEE